MFPDSQDVGKELGAIFDNLEEQLPEVPLPGPPVPQIPSPPRDKARAESASSAPAPVVEKEVNTGPREGSSKVVATPCRAPATSLIGTPATLKDSSSPETSQKDWTLFYKTNNVFSKSLLKGLNLKLHVPISSPSGTDLGHLI